MRVHRCVVRRLQAGGKGALVGMKAGKARGYPPPGFRRHPRDSERRTSSLQLDFVTWLLRQSPALRALIRLHQTRRGRLELRLAGEPTCVRVSVRQQGCTVWVERKGQVWDLLFALELASEQHRAGWRCRICTEAAQAFRFESLGALRAYHLFDPLAEWLMQKFMAARFLALHGSVGRVSWATLLQAEPADRTVPPRRLIGLHGCDTCCRSRSDPR